MSVKGKNSMVVNLMFLVLCLTSVVAQKTTSGSITYTINLAPELIKSISKTNNPNTRAILKNSKEVSYALNFNSKSSTYQKNQSLYNESKQKLNLVATGAGGTGIFYYNTEDNALLKQLTIGGDTFLITQNAKKWKLLNTSKKIGKYNCYRATLLDNNNKETKVTAWYTLDIPLAYGPKDYNGLPGIILELYEGKFFFKASKIELSNKNKIIEKPVDGLNLTQEEFNNRFKGFFDEK
ncbi:GLPGLI family protein [Cellulophaga lytica]|uniref:GLPGLI family protein n=1 Tax=Cellulophaga lytica TaxID=979 RepID=UPI0026E36010|nr:GLPGLI family protein [Cellulophaga lytica]MDO6852356.1 GLPGLI family protein [Cellulophaga lytica]